MIRMKTVLDVADNSGVKKVRCISVNGSTGNSVATVGDVIIFSCIDVEPSSKIKKGEKHYGVIVTTKAFVRRIDGSRIKFSKNAVVIINKASDEPIATRVLTPVAREIRTRFAKIASLAPEVI